MGTAMEQRACVRCKQLVEASGPHLMRLCKRCLKVLLSTQGEELFAFLNSLDQPAALVAKDQTVLHSNRHLGRMLEKFDHDIVGLRIGEALDCKNAANERRCGENEICLHCGLRRMVELSRISGETIAEFPVIIRNRMGGSQTFTLASGKAGDTVLLIIGMES